MVALQKSESIERAFAGFIVRTPEAIKRSTNCKLQNVVTFWQSFPQAQVAFLIMYVYYYAVNNI